MGDSKIMIANQDDVHFRTHRKVETESPAFSHNRPTDVFFGVFSGKMAVLTNVYQRADGEELESDNFYWGM